MGIEFTNQTVVVDDRLFAILRDALRSSSFTGGFLYRSGISLMMQGPTVQLRTHVELQMQGICGVLF